MPCTIAKLLKKLRSAFPETYVSITVSYDLFAHKKCIDIEYNLYFANNIENCRTFTNLKALKSYVKYICKPLTVNDVLNCGGNDLEVK